MSESNKDGKQYGMVLSKKNQLSVPKTGNVFGDDSNSDEDDGTDWVRKALKGEGEKNRVKKQTQLTMEKVLKENPTVYQYDEIYDEIERTKVEEKVMRKEEKKPKYMHNLLKVAERRKREQEHRIERMVQREREAEGSMFADKESFVTSAYKAKLEEFKKMEEEESRMDRLEAIGNVTKQQDMSGFYRHLYHQTVDGMEKDKSVDDIEKNKESKHQLQKGEASNIDRDDSLESDSTSEKNANSDTDIKAEKVKDTQNKRAKVKKSRQYRKRVTEASESDSDTQEHKLSDYKKEIVEAPSLDKGENNELDESKNKKRKLSPEMLETVNEDVRNIEKHSSDDDGRNVENTEINSQKSATEENKNVSVPEEKKEEKKVSIWEKRTVGPIFEAALQRYYARKATRLSCS